MKWIAGRAPDDGGDVKNLGPRLDSHHELQNNPLMPTPDLMPAAAPHPNPAPVLRPMRWLAHLPLVILPVLAAGAIQGPFLRANLTQEVTAALAAAGQGWASVSVRGRDVEIRGKPPGKTDAAAAKAAAAAVAGVRRVTMRSGRGA